MRLLIISIITIFFSCKNVAEQKATLDTVNTKENYVEYYESGIKRIEGLKINGERHGVWNFYYENGVKWSEGRYRNGKRDGYSLVYFKNGKKKLQGQYKNHKRSGFWKIWNEDGTFRDEINFDEPLTRKDSLLIYSIP